MNLLSRKISGVNQSDCPRLLLHVFVFFFSMTPAADSFLFPCHGAGDKLVCFIGLVLFQFFMYFWSLPLLENTSNLAARSGSTLSSRGTYLVVVQSLSKRREGGIIHFTEPMT